MNCPICKLKSEPYLEALKYYSGKSETCTLFYCKKCICFFKDAENGTLVTDFNSKGIKAYNDPAKYEWAYEKRMNFLRFVHRFFLKHVDQTHQISSWLDYGSGMGFLLNYLKEYYSDLAGIEISEVGREITSKKGVPAYQQIQDLPVGKKFDVISTIDSFYYTLQPNEIILSLKDRLNNNGYVVIRVSLRTWFIRLNKFFNKRTDNSLRDHFIDYSYCSIINLFEDNGFEKVAKTFKESGKTYYSPKIAILNFIIEIIYILSFGKLNLHTGVTLVFRKK